MTEAVVTTQKRIGGADLRFCVVLAALGRQRVRETTNIHVYPE